MPRPTKSNAAAAKNPRQQQQQSDGGKDNAGEETGQSHNLWVGNLSNDTTDSDLMDIFAKYGALDSVTTYSSRNFAFIYFKRLEDARAARDALQGTDVLGNPIKIEFARPARPGKHLWVGGISSSVSKEQLEEEFSKFGKIEEFKFLRDRNTALVDYQRLEDATAALKSMNGKRLGGEQIRVDFLRSQPSRRENWSDFQDARDGQFNNRRNTGPPTPYQHPGGGGRRGQQPSNVLWIGYPPSVRIDEQMLHNAMILFGEIERIKTYPSRHYSFVEFRSIDEARRAKEGLQGRLFNDPRIQILFSSSGLAPGKESPVSFQPGIRGTRSDMFFNEAPLLPMDFFGQNHALGQNNLLMRPFGGLQGGFDPIVDLAGLLRNFSESNPSNIMHPDRRFSSPATGNRPLPILPAMPGNWDGPDINNPSRRGPKRSRIGGSPIDERGILGPFRNPQDLSRHSPLVRGSHGQGTPEDAGEDHIWVGVIAKGGSPVCRARCVPIGKGLDFELPEVVNCSARTGLEMLAKHYEESSGFDIVFFLPDSEDDFDSYTEFLGYMGSKNRAGVAKLDDGTTLFLVPPSEFLTDVLHVSGPPRLYGVVLKNLNLPPQQMPTGAPMIPDQSQPPPIPPSPFVDRQNFPQHNYNSLLPQKDNQAFQMDYNNRLYREDSTHQPPKQILQNVRESPPVHSSSQEYSRNNTASSIGQSGFSLTPELLATLASIIPNTTQSSVTTSAQLPTSSSAQRAAYFPPSIAAREEQSVQRSPQLGAGHQFRDHPPSLPQYSAYGSLTNRSENPVQSVQDRVVNIPQQGNAGFSGATSNFTNPTTLVSRQFVPQQGGSSSRTSSHIVNPPQGGQHFVPQQQQQQQQQQNLVNQHYQYDPSHNSQRSYGSPLVFEQPQPTVSTITSSTQVQQLQSALANAGQVSNDGDVDKNQRYQSTLQFAANLLLQIQQQQQQGNNQAGQGSGNHQ